MTILISIRINIGVLTVKKKFKRFVRANEELTKIVFLERMRKDFINEAKDLTRTIILYMFALGVKFNFVEETI